MPYQLIYPGNADPYPDAHTAAQALNFLDLDGYGPVTIKDPDGYNITRKQLGDLVRNQFKAPDNA
jgi:hypothetical protein